jgi:hypothetical protein
MKQLHTTHEPYSIDLLNYEIASSIVNKASLPRDRFCGKRVRGSSARLANIKSRDKRLRKYNLSVMAFAS